MSTELEEGELSDTSRSPTPKTVEQVGQEPKESEIDRIIEETKKIQSKTPIQQGVESRLAWRESKEDGEVSDDDTATKRVESMRPVSRPSKIAERPRRESLWSRSRSSKEVPRRSSSHVATSKSKYTEDSRRKHVTPKQSDKHRMDNKSIDSANKTVKTSSKDPHVAMVLGESFDSGSQTTTAAGDNYDSVRMEIDSEDSEIDDRHNTTEVDEDLLRQALLEQLKVKRVTPTDSPEPPPKKQRLEPSEPSEPSNPVVVNFEESEYQKDKEELARVQEDLNAQFDEISKMSQQRDQILADLKTLMDKMAESKTKYQNTTTHRSQLQKRIKLHEKGLLRNLLVEKDLVDVSKKAMEQQAEWMELLNRPSSASSCSVVDDEQQDQQQQLQQQEQVEDVEVLEKPTPEKTDDVVVVDDAEIVVVDAIPLPKPFVVPVPILLPRPFSKNLPVPGPAVVEKVPVAGPKVVEKVPVPPANEVPVVAAPEVEEIPPPPPTSISESRPMSPIPPPPPPPQHSVVEDIPLESIAVPSPKKSTLDGTLNENELRQALLRKMEMKRNSPNIVIPPTEPMEQASETVNNWLQGCSEGSVDMELSDGDDSSVAEEPTSTDLIPGSSVQKMPIRLVAQCDNPSIDINLESCPYELMGRCKDYNCPFRHMFDNDLPLRDLCLMLLDFAPSFLGKELEHHSMREKIDKVIRLKEEKENNMQFFQRLLKTLKHNNNKCTMLTVTDETGDFDSYYNQLHINKV